MRDCESEGAEKLILLIVAMGAFDSECGLRIEIATSLAATRGKCRLILLLGRPFRLFLFGCRFFGLGRSLSKRFTDKSMPHAVFGCRRGRITITLPGMRREFVRMKVCVDSVDPPEIRVIHFVNRDDRAHIRNLLSIRFAADDKAHTDGFAILAQFHQSFSFPLVRFNDDHDDDIENHRQPKENFDNILSSMLAPSRNDEKEDNAEDYDIFHHFAPLVRFVTQ